MDFTVQKKSRIMAKMKKDRLYPPEKVQNSGPKQGPLRTLQPRYELKRPGNKFYTIDTATLTARDFLRRKGAIVHLNMSNLGLGYAKTYAKQVRTFYFPSTNINNSLGL